jgi:hypothetical protein
MAAISVATTDGITPISAVEDSNSSHYAIALAEDDQGRVHIAGNSLTGAPHYLRSAPNSLTSWTSVPWPFTNFSPTDAYCTYNIFNRLSDGRLLYALSQRYSAADARGDRYFLMILPLGQDNYQPITGAGTGEFCNASGSPAAGEADRVYLNNVQVEARATGDRVHVWGIFRTANIDATSQKCPWYIYSDDLVNWKRIDGSAQTIPLNWNNSGAATNSGAIISSAPGAYNSFQSGNMCIDGSSYPHVILKEGATSNQWHCWWNGTAWTSEVANTLSSCPTPFIYQGVPHMYRMYAAIGAQRMNKISSSGAQPQFQMGGPVDTSGYFISSPIQIRQGMLHFSTPNGDTPAVYEFGKHRRGIAS